jgi:hypothetical protein
LELDSIARTIASLVSNLQRNPERRGACGHPCEACPPLNSSDYSGRKYSERKYSRRKHGEEEGSSKKAKRKTVPARNTKAAKSYIAAKQI